MYIFREINDQRLRRFTDLVCEFPVSHVWTSAMKPALFLELGALHTRPQTDRPSGQVCVMIETDWSIKQGACVLGGSRFSDETQEERLELRVGDRIVEIAIREESGELTVRFDDGCTLETLTTWDHDAPAWAILLEDKDVISRIAPGWDGIDASFSLHVSKETHRVGIGYRYDEKTVKPGVLIKNIVL